MGASPYHGAPATVLHHHRLYERTTQRHSCAPAEVRQSKRVQAGCSGQVANELEAIYLLVHLLVQVQSRSGLHPRMKGAELSFQTSTELVTLVC